MKRADIPKASNERDLLQRVWQAMRIQRRFSISRLQAAAGEIGKPVHYVHVHRYLAALRRAGYVRQARAYRGQIGEPAIFQLARNSGPLRPLVRGPRLFDPNLRVWWRGEAAFTPHGESIADVDAYLRKMKVAAYLRQRKVANG